MDGCNDSSHGDPIVIVPVLDMLSFDFSNLPGAAECSVTLRPAVSVADFYRVRLLVRVHAATMNAGQVFRFTLYNTYPSPVDPAKEFVDSAGFLSVDVTDSVTSGTVVPRLVTGTGTDPDSHLKVVLTAIQGSAPATMKATLSASLLLRNGCSR